MLSIIYLEIVLKSVILVSDGGFLSIAISASYTPSIFFKSWLSDAFGFTLIFYLIFFT